MTFEMLKEELKRAKAKLCLANMCGCQDEIDYFRGVVAEINRLIRIVKKNFKKSKETSQE